MLPQATSLSPLKYIAFRIKSLNKSGEGSCCKFERAQAVAPGSIHMFVGSGGFGGLHIFLSYASARSIPFVSAGQGIERKEHCDA